MLTRWSILVLLQAVSLAAQVPGGHPKILGGEEVKQGEFPFVVRVFCTGSIIAPNWVLSAAHCFIDHSGRIADPSLYSVTLGRHRDHPIATRNVRRIVVHPDYDYTGNGGVKRDLALLQVFRPFPVSPVKLLKPDEEPPSGSPSTSVGWGRTSDGTYPDVLMRVDHTFLTPEECHRTTPWGGRRSLSQPPGFWVDEGVLCIGNEHSAFYRYDDNGNPIEIKGGIAPGDSGGPVLTPIPGGWGQIGIHSGLGGVELPALAERTSFSHDFITETISGEVPLIFAHFANGDGISSELLLLNTAPHPIQPEISFYDRGGRLLAPDAVVEVSGDMELTAGGALTVRTAMEPLAALTIATHGHGELVSGALKVLADARFKPFRFWESDAVPLAGAVRYSLPEIGVAGVGAGQPVRDALLPARRKTGGIRTAVVLHNREAEALQLRCRLMSGGVVLEEVQIPLEAHGQTSWFLEDAFLATDMMDFVGTVRCTAPGKGNKFTAFSLEMDDARRILTTLPAAEVDQMVGERRETVLDFAHFANGSGITSELLFVNLETLPSGPDPTYPWTIFPSRPAIYFYDTQGDPIASESLVDLTGDLEVAEDGSLTVRTEMDPLGELTISTHGRGDLVSGSVRVVSEGPIGGMLRYSVPGVGVTGVGAGSSVRDALFPARRREGGIRTAAAMHNVGEEAMEVTCRLMSEGAVLGEAKIPLEANGQTSWFIEDEFPATDTSDFVGTVRCTAPGEGRFTGLAVEVDAGNRIFTTLPVAPVPEMPSAENTPP